MVTTKSVATAFSRNDPPPTSHPHVHSVRTRKMTLSSASNRPHTAARTVTPRSDWSSLRIDRTIATHPQLGLSLSLCGPHQRLLLRLSPPPSYRAQFECKPAPRTHLRPRGAAFPR